MSSLLLLSLTRVKFLRTYTILLFIKRKKLNRSVPDTYQNHIETRTDNLFGSNVITLRPRGFYIGIALSFFLAIGAPYANMIIRGSYMARDFTTPGAIAIFLLLVGPINALLKWTKTPIRSATLFFVILTFFINRYLLSQDWDVYSPGFIFMSFTVMLTFINLLRVFSGRDSLTLNRAELILVYIMLLIVSALCTMGFSEQFLPMITALFYFATPENKWQEQLFPFLIEKEIMVNDGNGNSGFYEGVTPPDGIPWESWIEPFFWWSIFFFALYVCMVSISVILRRQWTERERLSYPLTQVALDIVREEDPNSIWNGFLKNRIMWYGASIPIVIGSLNALHRYDPAFPIINLLWFLPFFGQQVLQIGISFAMIGFSYFINTNIAAGIWFFHLFSKFQKEILFLIGMKSEQKISYGVSQMPLMAYQGVGALITMVLIGFWIGRNHYLSVFKKAIGIAPNVEDRDEIISYRAAVMGCLGGIVVMSFWLWIMGTKAWVALIFVLTAIIIFIGITRIVSEAGLAAVRTPMIAPDLLTLGLGSSLIGTGGIWNFSLAYIWASDVRVFVMANCANGLKLIEEMPLNLRRMVFGAIMLALFVGAMGSIWMIFNMAYQHGGINLNSWFFKSAPAVAYKFAQRNIESTGIYWTGWGFFAGGGLTMLLMTIARQRFYWWPVHPIGFPIGGNYLMEKVWFSIFCAWFIKLVLMRYGGANLFKKSQKFFLGLIAGQFMCSGVWLVLDYFTGKIGNVIFDI